MPTTVEVDEKTLQMLNRVKKEMKAKSHDEVIKILIIERKKFPAPCLVQTANWILSQNKTRLNSMSCNYIIDAYAWIEYFKASKLGAIAKKNMENKHSAALTIVISEIRRKLQKEIMLGNETQEGRQNRWEFISATSRIIDLDFETAAEAGKLFGELKNKAKGWGLADSIILCTARNFEGKVVTRDERFREL